MAVSYEAREEVFGLPTGEVPPGDALHVGGGREVDRGLGALLRALHERSEDGEHEPHPATRVLLAERRADHSGVERVRRDARPLEPAGQLVGEQDVGQLGLVVRALTAVAPLALEVVEVDAAHGLRARRDGDDPGRGGGPEPVQQQVRQQERREVVDRERALQTVLRDMPCRPVAAHVVHQDVEARVCRAYLLRETAHLALGGQVGGEDVDITACPADPLRGRLGPGLVAPDDAHPGPETGETGGRGQADPTGPAGDQHGLAGHRGHVSGRS